MPIRLDKFLSENTMFSRSELKEKIRRGAVTVDGVAIQSPETKVDSEKSLVCLSGVPVRPSGTRCFMLNKPAGYVTAASDPKEPTVMKLLPAELRHLNLQPVGRLDKDTEGLLLFTNDGALLHRIISPRHNVIKRYYARHEGVVTESDIEAFHRGIVLRDGTACKPAELEIIEDGEAIISVSEGKYHQVRRMMASLGHTVTYLKRISEGSLTLGDLPAGALRELSEDEIRELDSKE